MAAERPIRTISSHIVLGDRVYDAEEPIRGLEVVFWRVVSSGFFEASAFWRLVNCYYDGDGRVTWAGGLCVGVPKPGSVN